SDLAQRCGARKRAGSKRQQGRGRAEAFLLCRTLSAVTGAAAPVARITKPGNRRSGAAGTRVARDTARRPEAAGFETGHSGGLSDSDSTWSRVDRNNPTAGRSGAAQSGPLAIINEDRFGGWRKGSGRC